MLYGTLSLFSLALLMCHLSLKLNYLKNGAWKWRKTFKHFKFAICPCYEKSSFEGDVGNWEVLGLNKHALE
jgi:hypothetical protein